MLEKKGKKRTKRILSLLLVFAMLITSIPNMGFTTRAADAEDTRVTDASTIDNWERYFGEDYLSTENAGGIWTDKSVFKDATELAPVTMKDDANNFLVAMSAIAANKSITGYSTIPTDTMLVLDLSGSMVTGNQNNTTSARVAAMVDATNDAIAELLKLNKNNRVGVVLYSGNSNFGTSNVGTATLLLPLDRYYIDSAYTDDRGDKFEADDFLQVTTNNGIHVRVSQGKATNTSQTRVIVKNSNDETVTAQNKQATGGTYTQNGMYLAWEEFASVEDTTIQDSFQAGTKRMPIMVLMSDGAPTTATTSFYDVGTSNVGNGNGNCATDEVGFLTQLTGAWVRSSMEDHYDNTAKVYTLGFGLDALTSGQDVAESVLDPANSTSGIDDLWDDYVGMSGNSLTLYGVPGTNDGSNAGSKTIQISKNARITSVEQQNYVDEYFEASTEKELIEAFDDIVEQIVLQSKYYPTEAENDEHNLGGYISFEDDLGHFMEVKDLKGILLGSTLYDGAKMAQTILGGGLGTADNPTEKGDEFIYSVIERLGLESVAAARELVRQAWLAGQLSYTDEDEYSNYIGWYADKDGNYLGFWSESHTADDAPANAVYTMKSYGYMGYGSITSEESIKDSDLMYMTVRVQTDIASGDQAVHWSIPAALIPTVTYKVTMEGSNYEEAEQLNNIDVTIEPANPVRLVYEVGLVDEINELTIADIMAQEDHVHHAPDGSFYFYTNKWGDNNDDGETDIDYTDPYTHQVTTVDYEPSVENERYYYTEDSTIYVKNGDSYTPVSSDPRLTAGTYYHARKVFVITDEATGEATIETRYEEITAESLAKATKYTDKNQWYIPAGTILRLVEQYMLRKDENTTETLEYVAYPFIYNPTPETDEDYHSDVFLGNNGRITITPATGIKLTKTVDAIEPGTNVNNFEFVIKLTAPQGVALASSYPCVRFDASGNQVGEEFNVTVDDDGTMATIVLENGQSVYIKDLPAGTTYEITENAHEDYIVKSINGDESADKAEGTITDKVLEQVDFVNTLRTHGSLIIDKTVTHPLGSNYIIPDGIEFTVNVDLDGTAVGDLELEIVRAASSGKITTDSEGKFSFKIKSSELVAIHNIPNGATYTIIETDLPNGFSLNTAESTALEGTISTDVNAVERLVNDYDPANVNPVNITLEGTKKVEGRKWLETDSFSFELQKYEGGQWVTVGTQKTVTASSKSFDFTTEMQREVFDAVGTYQYRVIEVEGTIGGITYDKTIRYFDITVTDVDMDGKLEIAATDGVHATAPTVVTERTESGQKFYDIVTDFTNRYAPNGSAQFEIDITKTISNTTGVDIASSGFVFELYEATVTNGTWTIGEKATESTETNALGEAIVGMVYEPDDLTESDGSNSTVRIEEKTYYYILKEKIPTGSDKIKGMTYTEKEYKVTVVLKDNLDGTMSTVVSVDGVLDTETSNAAETSFENVYDLGETEVSLTASKKLTGRDMTAGEFEFGLYEASEDFAIGNMIEKVENVAAKDGVSSVLTFKNLVFDAVGTYHYIVREIIPEEIEHNGIVYDTTEYRVVVTVTDNGNGGLASEVTVNGVAYASESMAFNNGYTAAKATEDFQGRKILNGRPLRTGEFSFELYETSDDYKTDGLTALETKQNTSTGIFAFDPIEYNEKGTHYYVIKEVAGTLGGVSYSQEVYKIKVEVTDNGQGALETQTTVNGVVDGLITFTNTYSADSVEVPIQASKTLTGRDMEANEFTFELVDKNGSVVDTAKNGAANAGVASTFSFDDLEFNSTGVYNYTVREVLPDVNDRLGGVVYDRIEYDVEITVTDDGNGQLQAVVKVDGTEGKAMTFTNAYSATGTSTVISATKIMTGRDLQAGEFFFDLHELSTGRILQTKGNEAASKGEAGAVVFDAIVYDAVGEYQYTVNERNTNKEGITYDSAVYTVTVTVTDNGKGQLEAKQSIVKGESENVNAIAFNNYDPVDAKVTIEGTKELTGRRLRANEFTFELYEAEFTGGKVVPSGAAIDTDQNTALGAFSFDEFTYNTEGTHYYVVKENVPADTDENKTDGIINGVTYDKTVYYVKVEVTDDNAGTLKATTTISTSDTLAETVGEIEFNNTYKAAEGAVRITGVKKILNGRELTRGEFEFQLIVEAAPEASGLTKGDVIETAVNGKVWDKTNKVYVNAGEVNAVVFDDLVYEHGEAGPYKYKIVEVDNGLGGVTYSEEVYYVTIEVTDNIETGKIEVSTPVITNASGNNATPEFTNTYTASPVDVQLEASKNLVGKDLHKDNYSFKLQLAEAPDGATIKTGWVDKIAANGNIVGAAVKEFAFEKLTLDKAGTYKFTMSEVIPSDATNNSKAGVTYDDTVYNVTIQVTDNGEGALIAGRPVYTDSEGNPATPVFTNTYTVKAAAKAVVGVTKVLTGRDMAAGEFGFQLVDEYGVVMSEGKNEAATEGKSAAVVFDSITYEAKGTYEYTVEEVKGSLGGVKYSEAKYKVTVEVTDNGDGTLTVGDAVFTDLEGQTAEPVFTNEYTVTKNAKAVVGVTKVLTGRDMAAGEFKFELLDKDDNFVAKGKNVIATEGKPAAVVFDEIEYTAKGTYEYTVVEVKENLGGVKYSEEKYKVTVKVTDNGDGTLAVGDAVFTDLDGKDATPEFTNKYTVTPKAGTVVGITKVLVGRDMAADEFKFQLVDAEGKVVAEGKNKAAKDGESAKVVFDEITYEAKGTYEYTVKEVSGTLYGVNYSETKYKVIVEVTDNGDGTLTVGDAVFTDLEGKVATPVFTNTYTVPNVTVEKTQAAGGEPTKETMKVSAGSIFTYYMKVTNSGTAAATGIVITDKVPAGLTLVKDSATGGNSIEVLADGTISWTINELAAGMSSVVSFQVVIPTVKEDTTWKNVATVVYGNNPDGPDVPEESNEVTVTSEEPSPQTGDNTSIGMWSTLAFGSLMVCGFLLINEKKRRNEL